MIIAMTNVITNVDQFRAVSDLFDFLDNLGIIVSFHSHAILSQDYGEYEPRDCCGNAYSDCYCDDGPRYDDYYEDEELTTPIKK